METFTEETKRKRQFVYAIRAALLIDHERSGFKDILDGEECRQHKFMPVDERTKSLITEVADLIFEKKIDKATFVTAASTVKLVVTDKAVKVSRERIEKICFE